MKIPVFIAVLALAYVACVAAIESDLEHIVRMWAIMDEEQPINMNRKSNITTVDSMLHTEEKRAAPPGKPAANGTATNATAPSSSNRIQQSGTAAPGSDAPITANTNQGGCSMENDLANNQQASWSETTINTCCVGETSTSCWVRIQAKADPSVACTIPSCDALQSNDMDKMLGFRPQSSSNGHGKYANVYPILFLSAAGRTTVPMLFIIVAPIVASFVLM